jgi:hypothetical protein
LWDFQIGPQVFRLTKAAVSGGEAEVDAVRIGTSANNMQALIWLGSPRGTISLGAANSLVREVVQLCRHHGLLDIECEMRVTNVLKTTILINPFAVRAETAPWSGPFSLQVGTPITFRTDPAEDRLHSLGSLGVYLRLRDQPHAFALTAAHCLGLEEELPFMLRPDPNVLGNEVYIHTVDTFKADVDDLREKIAALDNESRYARDTINQMNRHGTHDPAAKNEYESQESAALASKTVLSAWLTTMETHYAEPKDRMIGRVHFRPPVLHSLMTPSNANDFGLGYSQDIGLIKTDILVDGPEAKDVNRIGLRMTADRQLVGIPSNQLLVTGVLDKEQLAAGGITVFKQGARTGLTAGKTGALRSFTMKGGEDSVQIPVVGLPTRGYRLRERDDFSAGGDSGAVAMTQDGMLVGLMHSGSGEEGQGGIEKIDITHITPFWWILERLRHYGFDVSLL